MTFVILNRLKIRKAQKVFPKVVSHPSKHSVIAFHYTNVHGYTRLSGLIYNNFVMLKTFPITSNSVFGFNSKILQEIGSKISQTILKIRQFHLENWMKGISVGIITTDGTFSNLFVNTNNNKSPINKYLPMIYK